MNIQELIDAAKRAKGSLGAVAAGLGMHQNRLGDWRAGRRKPDANEIAYLAECAGLPVLETVAEIEAQLNTTYAPIWQAALGKLRAAGVAATVILGLSISSMMIPSDAHATSSATWFKTDPLRQETRKHGPLRPVSFFFPPIFPHPDGRIGYVSGVAFCHIAP